MKALGTPNIDVQRCSRHRDRFSPPHTPKGYWGFSFGAMDKEEAAEAFVENDTQVMPQ